LTRGGGASIFPANDSIFSEEIVLLTRRQLETGDGPMHPVRMMYA
jgi:hypothetical protein